MKKQRELKEYQIPALSPCIHTRHENALNWRPLGDSRAEQDAKPTHKVGTQVFLQLKEYRAVFHYIKSI